jgi:hypothetical protein
MIVAFIATDLIVVNKENRMDEVKKYWVLFGIV